MKEVNVNELQELLNSFANKDVYIHLETTNGAYASHFDEKVFNSGAFIRNVKIRYELDLTVIFVSIVLAVIMPRVFPLSRIADTNIDGTEPDKKSDRCSRRI
ncbi:hypothetical protein UACE39S_00871 [Ureibacillus acetophenoni]